MFLLIVQVTQFIADEVALVIHTASAAINGHKFIQ
jgi:hypothetical protein